MKGVAPFGRLQSPPVSPPRADNPPALPMRYRSLVGNPLGIGGHPALPLSSPQRAAGNASDRKDNHGYDSSRIGQRVSRKLLRSQVGGGDSGGPQGSRGWSEGSRVVLRHPEGRRGLLGHGYSEGDVCSPDGCGEYPAEVLREVRQQGGCVLPAGRPRSVTRIPPRSSRGFPRRYPAGYL